MELNATPRDALVPSTFVFDVCVSLCEDGKEGTPRLRLRGVFVP